MYRLLIDGVKDCSSKARSSRYWFRAPMEFLLVHQRYGYKSVFMGTKGYTTVQTVFSVVSNLTAFASVGFKFVSYIGFSNDACPLLFSCPAYPLYCTLGLALWNRSNKWNKKLNGYKLNQKHLLNAMNIWTITTTYNIIKIIHRLVKIYMETVSYNI